MCDPFASFKIARREKEVGEVEERERGNYPEWLEESL